jgi:hypothetical protein
MIIKITRFPCIVHLIVSHSSENRYNGYLELSKIGQIQMRGKARLWGHPKALDIVYRNGKW